MQRSSPRRHLVGSCEAISPALPFRRSRWPFAAAWALAHATASRTASTCSSPVRARTPTSETRSASRTRISTVQAIPTAPVIERRLALCRPGIGDSRSKAHPSTGRRAVRSPHCRARRSSWLSPRCPGRQEPAHRSAFLDDAHDPHHACSAVTRCTLTGLTTSTNARTRCVKYFTAGSGLPVLGFVHTIPAADAAATTEVHHEQAFPNR